MSDNPRPRNLIVLFDGTNKNYESGTNVALFREALVQPEHEDDSQGGQDEVEQLVHYERGIGAVEEDINRFPNARQLNSSQDGIFERWQDLAVAKNLKKHLLSGYTFVLQNFRKDDKIFILGYSRGAHLARALAGMIYKVGLVPGYNERQVDRLYDLYEGTDRTAWDQCEQFRRGQRLNPDVEFLGLWDTVSSVGLIRRHLPFTRISTASNIKHIRHAVCLDERRGRFLPDLYKLPARWIQKHQARNSVKWRQFELEQEFSNRRENRIAPIVDEEWFVGCHSDVGGDGSHTQYLANPCLSRIALRWMILQCILFDLGLRFRQDVLLSYGITFNGDGFPHEPNLWPQPIDPNLSQLELVRNILDALWFHNGNGGPGNIQGNGANYNIRGCHEISRDFLNALMPIHDTISWKTPYWVILGGIRARDPDLPIQLHPTVDLRRRVLELVLNPTHTREIRTLTKLLRLRKYEPNLLR